MRTSAWPACSGPPHLKRPEANVRDDREGIVRRRLHDPDERYAKWGGQALMLLWLLILLISAFDPSDKLRPFRAMLEEEPLMWAVFGSTTMLVPAAFGLLSVGAFYLPLNIRKKPLVLILGSLTISVFVLMIFLSGSRGVAVYEDRLVYRDEALGGQLQIAYFRDLQSVEIGCSSIRRYGSRHYSLLYRLNFRNGFSKTFPQGRWNASSLRRLQILRGMHQNASARATPVLVAKNRLTGEPFNDPACMAHLLADYAPEQRTIVRELFSDMPSRASRAQL